MATTAKQKGVRPQILKSNMALKLAERWVDNMTKTVGDDETTDKEPESRPSRLGLGAKVSRQTKFRPSDDNPVERKLHAKLESGKRKAAKRLEDSTPSAKDQLDDDDDKDDDHELESRSSAFGKKRAGPQLLALQATTKRK